MLRLSQVGAFGRVAQSSSMQSLAVGIKRLTGISIQQQLQPTISQSRSFKYINNHWQQRMQSHSSSSQPLNPQFASLLAQATTGNVPAQCQVALLYSTGSEAFGVQPDAPKAFAWNKKAAESGNAEAQAALGMLLYQGHGCTQDMNEAFEWTLKAADQGLSDAQSIVGDMLFHGLGVDVDKKKAFYYTKEAALQEHKFSQIKLASMYLMGDGVQSDVDEAKSWALKATGEEIDFVNPGQWLHDKMGQLLEEEAAGEKKE
ncbi:UNVERIFIED_CONTAM: hypothetical protein HDU68_007866 [Siphonaria sp. JEL0065]|nr:hypothetical protein HDU68_007866 [Siphonaria sp. JEL0065]